VVGLIDPHTADDLPKWKPLVPTCYKVTGPAVVGYNRHFIKRLFASPANIGHIHSIWSYITFAMFAWAKKNKYPYLISPNGMLDEWAINNSRWKKRLALFLGVRKILNNASCLQVNTLHEYISVRKFGLSNPVCKISNGVNMPDLSETYISPWADIPEAKSKRTILYLSRIHHKKGVHLLLEAWNQLRLQRAETLAGWQLVIVGFQFNEDPYEKKLLSYIEDNLLGSYVTLLEGQYGRDMDRCYANCDAFILPSFSEGVPMAVLHAWSFKKPAIITGECNLPEGFAYDAAVKINPDVTSIFNGILEIVNASPAKMQYMGEQAEKLVREKFTWSAVADQLIEVYKWVYEGGNTPSTVIID
jgi:poly(glycerol-phosphate) alpha-glucosyltransferase